MTIETRRVTWPIEPRGAARGRTERSAILVALRLDGVVGLGEAAPLPGMSGETIDDVARDLASVAGRLDVLTPSARFALETARLDAHAQARGVSIAELLGGAARRIPVAAVVDSVAEARDAWAHGIRTLKLKLRPNELALAHAIVDALPAVRLRIDANRSWPRDRVHALVAELPRHAIDYIEEPCAGGIDDLAVPLSVDESLVDDPRGHELRDTVLVLKPTLLGGFERCMALARSGRRAIVTHALEGPIGTAACAELALAIGGTDAVGLAPHPALAGFRVAQLRDAHVERATHPGLGFSPAEREELWNRG